MNPELKAAIERLDGATNLPHTGEPLTSEAHDAHVRDLRLVLATLEAQRHLLAEVQTSLLAGGWRDDELYRKVKAAAAKP